jgi:hypothetical protein
MESRCSYAIPPEVFEPLRSGFDHGRPDPDGYPVPVDPTTIERIAEALDEAVAAKLPGLPVIVELDHTELAVLGVCFEVGGEDNGTISLDQWQAVTGWINDRS